MVNRDDIRCNYYFATFHNFEQTMMMADINQHKIVSFIVCSATSHV
jgi:hypothetical protein